MFFIFSKVFYFLLSPISWMLILLVLAYLLKKYRKKLQLLTVVILLIFSNSFITDWALKTWEADPVKPSELKESYDAVIVLGGFAGWDIEGEKTVFSCAADRFLQALHLFYTHDAKKLIISGGSSKLLIKERKEADVVKEYLTQIMVPDSMIAIDTLSRNTYENALECAKLIENDSVMHTAIVVTSAFHIPRAKGCFEKQNINCEFFPAHRMSNTGKFNMAYLVTFNPGNFNTWHMLIKEWVGILAYKIKGYM
ncbi:YdcF family protein [Bacteroidales bacterium]|nr:YdcF family protein [Bacteroidales bacterium]